MKNHANKSFNALSKSSRIHVDSACQQFDGPAPRLLLDCTKVQRCCFDRKPKPAGSIKGLIM